MTRISALLVSASLLAGGALPVHAAAPAPDYPQRPLRMLVPFAPGGASDYAARVLQQQLVEELGQQIVVDNRSGAAGNIAVEGAARANPDGYTLLLGNVGTMAINPSMLPSFPIRPVRDLTGISLVGDTPGAFAVHPSIPATSIRELIEYAKGRPGQLNYGSAAVGSAQRLYFEFFMSRAGLKLVHVPYKTGAAGVIIAALAGEVQVATGTVTPFLPHHKTGKVRVLAVIAPQRIAQLPDVPTMVESGYPEIRLGSWAGLYVAAGTPRPVVDRLFAATIKGLAKADVPKKMAGGGVVLVTSKSVDEFAAFMKAQTEFWAKIVAQTGAAAE